MTVAEISHPPFRIAGFNINMYGRDRLKGAAGWQQSIDDLVHTGSNTVLVTTPYFQSSRFSSDVAANSVNTESDANLAILFDELRIRGFAVGYKFTLIPSDGTWSGAISPSDPAAWFAAYEAHVVRLARLAEAHGVRSFYIANEMQSMATVAHAASWNHVVDSVKAAYTGALSWNAVLNASAFPDGEAFTIPVSARLDYIGVSFYEPLTAKNDPTVAQLVQAWSANRQGHDLARMVAELHTRTGKPIVFSEIAYRSVDGTNVDPAEFAVKPSDRADPQEQADCYEAFMEVWTRDKPDWLLGVLWWQWMIEPLPDHLVSHDQTPQHLAAQSTMTAWFTGKR